MNKTINPRKPLTAFIISLFLPGLGQLYNGNINKASWFLMAFVLFSIPTTVLAALYLPPEWTSSVLLAATFLSVFTWVYSLLEAIVDTKHHKEYVRKNWQGAGTYILVFVLCSLMALPLMTQYVKDHWVEAYRIPSGSMEPTVIAGDFIFADKRYNCPSCKHTVKRGDVVVFTYPNNRNINYIKRVIGLPGDRVQISGEAVTINGKTLAKQIKQQDGMNVVTEHSGDASWIVIWKQSKRRAKPMDYDITVASGQAFMLGDNRNASNDSRFFGTIPLQDIKGKARQIWLSYNKKLGGLKMDRAGKQIR